MISFSPPAMFLRFVADGWRELEMDGRPLEFARARCFFRWAASHRS
jgi:hypothetical protein